MALLVVVEGLDYSGKSTTVNELITQLESMGKRVIKYREPGSTPVGEAIKRLTINPNYTMNDKTSLLLFFAARNELVTRHLSNLTKDDQTVIILDRYIASSFAYAPRHLWDFIWTLKTLVNPPAPDLTVYLDIDKETFMERLEASKRVVEADPIELALKNDFSNYRKRYDDYFTRADNGELIRLNSRYPVESHVYRIISAIERLT